MKIMSPYKKFEETVYNYLLTKHQNNPSFTFSIRKLAKKGAETDYFIGKESSNYFATTFWYIPVAYPGNANELISVIFRIKANQFTYNFKFLQTKNPADAQNEAGLKLVKNLRPLIKEIFSEFSAAGVDNKMENYWFSSPQPYYKSIEDMLTDFENQLEKLLPIVDEEIRKIKLENNSFTAGRYTQQEFNKMLATLGKRREKYKSLNEEAIIEERDGTKNYDSVINNSKSFEDFVRLIIKLGEEASILFFSYAEQLMSKLNISSADQRFTFGTSKNNRLTITIGQRYCLVYNPSEELSWQFINDNKIANTEDITVDKFEGDPLAYYYRCFQVEEVEKRFEGIVKESQKQLSRTDVSGYRQFNNEIFEKAVFDNDFRNQIYDAAFGPYLGLTGNVWKLGCNWAKGTPSFYEFLKQRSIVLAISDKLYSVGDLIIITVDQTVHSIGEVMELPKTVLDFPDFKSEFAYYKIPYDDTINISKVEWYELTEEDKFIDPLQQGICKVHGTYREKVLEIWNDRFTNYWIFQCNPKEFDFETAVKKNLLHDWTVAAHKDKIKKNDKVILWLTGKNSGCYALANVTSEPSESDSSTDDSLWKTKPRNSLKSGVEITHNLIAHPLLWKDIKSKVELADLKVGNQGTNFTATRTQYNGLLEIINKSNQHMSNNINLYINTIFYGPPGTGKTFKLNEYKEEYFTDRDITRTTDEVLKEKIPFYPFWKILASVLNYYDRPVSVTELLENKVVKAKLNPDAKTPRNTVWRILQSYANDASTEMDAKYKGPIQLFQKDQESKWSIIPEKKNELNDIIDQELLEIAANPDQEYEAKKLPKHRYKFITFHQKYSYEDFIEGIKPLLKNEEVEEQVGELQFELKKGVFYNSCLEALRLVGYDSFLECYNDTVENRLVKFNEAKNNPAKQFALFIDEINRANISAVFGELITLLEEDKRMGTEYEMWVELPYSNEKFCVPANLYVIGTMNTADRSIALLDIALRRRFEFLSLYPEYHPNTWWSELLIKLNQAIYTKKNNPDFFIGHTFFLNKIPEERLKILNTKIIPLLYEYCQNNVETIKQILAEAGVVIKPIDINENFKIIAE